MPSRTARLLRTARRVALLATTSFALLYAYGATAGLTLVPRESATLSSSRSGATGLRQSAWGRERDVVAPPHEVDAVGRLEDRKTVMERRETRPRLFVARTLSFFEARWEFLSRPLRLALLNNRQ